MRATTVRITTEVTINPADERATFAIQPHQAPASYVIRVTPRTTDERQDHKTAITHVIDDDFEEDVGVRSFEDAVTIAWAEFIQQLNQYFGEACGIEVKR